MGPSRLTVESDLRELERLRAARADLYAVHYACESIHGIPAGPPAVSAVGFQALTSSELIVFSQIDRPQDSERYVLHEYFNFLKQRDGCRLVHWRMNLANYGFTSLANRFTHLPRANSENGSWPFWPFSLFIKSKLATPPLIPTDRTFSLPELIAAQRGGDAEELPRMNDLFKINGLVSKHVLGGKDEASALARSDHAAVRASVAEKVQHLATLANRLIDGDLETDRSGRRVRFGHGTLDPIQVVCDIASRFNVVSRQLAKRHGGRPKIELNDEYDYQDIFHAALRLFFENVEEEAWTPKYAGGASRIDFVLPEFRVAIELKHGKNLDAKKVGEQLIIDIARYAANPKVRYLVCIVFDREGKVANPRGIEGDLASRKESLGVTVKIVDA